MIIEQITTRFRFRANGLIRRAMALNIPGFGAPKVVVTEHPKSGGTWLSQMLAAYLDIPNPLFRVPPRSRCILQGHFLRVADAHDTVVLWRDGRDVMVSHYYFHLFYRDALIPGWSQLHCKRLGIEDARDIQRYLPRFIEYCYADGPPRRMNWSSFANIWKNRNGYAETRYEALLASPERELKKILRHISVDDIDEARLEESVARFSFENVTGGRKPGEEKVNSFVRKGIAGDWKNKFTREAREVFDYYGGQTLIDLEYEADHAWVDAVAE